MRRDKGKTWQSLLSLEPYGWHFSVSGKRRKPSDAEAKEAMSLHPEVAELVEVENPVKVNPYVRHFMSREAAKVTGMRILS